MHIFSLALACFLLAPCGIAAVVRRQGQDVRALLTASKIKWSADTTISFPGDQNFNAATERWTIFRPPTYQAAVSPGTERDVVATVQLASSRGIPFLATGGRHGYGTTLGKLKNGLALDLSKLKTMHVDKAAGTLTVGPGVVFADVFDPVYHAGFQMTTGTCSCVGVMGATLGAGVGRLSGLYGLMIDSLVSSRVVTADGRVLEVSETSNPDLFWGIRGAGANFGVMISATYKLHPLVNGGIFTSIDMSIPAEQNVSFFNALESLSGKNNQPAKLSVITSVNYNHTINKPYLKVSWTYAGAREEALKLAAPILSLKPTVVNISSIPWNRLSAEASFGFDAQICESDSIYDVYGANLRSISASTYSKVFNKMASFYAEQPDGRDSTITLESFANEGSLAVRDDATAYPWRDAKTNVLLIFIWQESSRQVETPATNLALDLRRDFAATSGYDGLSVYVNYAHGDESLEKIYGKNKLPRLANLKKKFDPHNVFGFNNALPTRYP